MTVSHLTQLEADHLLTLEKRRIDRRRHGFPTGGTALHVPLKSVDGREEFILDVSRGRIDLSKVTYQQRARAVVILARLDISGPPHRNPDGTEVPSPHLHLYREGFGDKWAVAAPSQFSDVGDHMRTLDEFLKYTNVIEPPIIDPVLSM